MQQDGLLTLRSAGITALQRESENIPHESLDLSIARSSHLVLSHQHREGFWWYTLEANESINAEYILLMHYLDAVDEPAQAKLARRLLSSQTDDGSWPIYFGGPGDLSVTIECYLALKLSGQGLQSESMLKACQFILSKGGLSQCRVFTRIHLALFALIPWEACPSMPLPFVNFPVWFPVSIYEFSSWARACIVPLLIILNKKKMRPLPADFLFELYVEKFPKDCDWSYKIDKGNFTLEKFFIEVDKLLRKFDKIPVKPLKRSSLEACEEWIREHVSRTEDIYPALAYAAMALHNLGRPMDDPTIQKALNALKSFQMETGGDDLHPLPSKSQGGNSLYQQCCVSPVWDSPWAAMALLESGVSPHHESLLKAARWLISKQILDTYGDWSFKNSKALPGGWSFEFENDYFPDVDDTIEVLHFLSRVALPYQETKLAMERGLNWLVSMQSRNGGWAAFDMDNVKEFVNKIPFSDHGACLDPPTPDITARAIELLAQIDREKYAAVIHRGIRFLEKTQESNGPWWGRWGVNYLYGTWCVLQGLAAVGYDMNSARIQKAVRWLKSVQREDGGFGESCLSYETKQYEGLDISVPSQTAWALMGLVAAGETFSQEAQRAALYLMKAQDHHGGWEEKHFTGTGFPGHFYIRYHGYRHFFPLFALSLYRKSL